MLKKSNKLLVFIFPCLITFTVNAQEIRTPLLQNVQLKTNSIPLEKISNKKNVQNFPLVDYFINDGFPAASKWYNNGCNIVNRKLNFNAQTAAGINYPDTQNLMDQLTSTIIDLSSIYQPVFISFTISSGQTFSNGDSLILEAKDIFGGWQSIWKNYGLPLQNQEVVFSINTKQFFSADFELRWSAYSTHINSSNTQTFLLSKFVLSQTLPLQWNDNIVNFNLDDTTASLYSFNSPDVNVDLSGNTNFTWGNCLRLDNKNAQKQIYGAANGSYGGADTLFTNVFNVSNYAVNDSIFFSFALRGLSGLKLTDTLLVEFKSNLGSWVRTYAFAGVSANTFNVYNFNINKGRNRHANFQVRFIFKTNYVNNDSAAWLVSGFSITRKIGLPFVDDFSASRKIVDSDKWADKFVFVNNDFPRNQPSVNVATFDGLDEHGNAYSKFALKGTCDILTSLPINLSNSKKSDSLIISFYYQYQPQGNTFQVYPDDSFILDLRTSRFDKDSFETVWMVNARDTFLGTFQRYDYVITDPKYFHDEFQFRFKNHGSLTGNLSHWHLDYVRFDKGRKMGDAYDDISLTNTPRVMLGMYTSMPWNQYKANLALYGNQPDSIRIANHHVGAYNVDYLRTEVGPFNDTIDKYVNNFGNLLPLTSKTFSIGNSFNFKTTANADSLIFDTRYRIKISGTQIDNISSNDTFGISTVFSNYLAYDDGTAEAGYGIQLKTNVGACLKYKIEIPDSIYGVYIFFNQSEKDVSTQKFNIKVWQNISPLFEQATSDKVLYSEEIQKPVYTGTVNGFAAFKFATPIAVKDSFFIGWDQVNAFVLNVGMDENYPSGVNPNMMYKMDGRWYPGEEIGALMIRPIIGKFLDLPASVVQTGTVKLPEITIYPNPVNNILNIETTDSKEISDYAASLFDLTGRKVFDCEKLESKILLPQVPAGLYIFVMQDKYSQVKITRKLIINQNN